MGFNENVNNQEFVDIKNFHCFSRIVVIVFVMRILFNLCKRY